MSDHDSGAGNDDNGVDGAIDPAAAGAVAPEPAAVPGGKRRGRPPGGGGKSGGGKPRPASGTGKTEKGASLDLSSLTGMFVGLHLMLAMKTGRDEIAISPDEGAAFMKAAQRVMSHYSVEATQKTIDWISFGGIAVGIYGPRIVALTVGNGPAAGVGHNGGPPMGGAEIFPFGQQGESGDLHG